MRLWLATKTFFRVLFNARAAEQVRAALGGAAAALPAGAAQATTDAPGRAGAKSPSADKPAKEPKAEVKKKPSRSEALTLLAALQREARFIDIVKEPLQQYTDAQIGAAARDVLRDCGLVLERMFQLRPVVEAEEGAPIEAPAQPDPQCYRLSGNVPGNVSSHAAAPGARLQGNLVHAGWKATQCQLPEWSGGEEAARVVAPVELEIK